MCILLVCAMGLFFASCAPGDSSADTPQIDPENPQELQLLQSDFRLTPEQQLSRIKADRLIENQGYSADDEVVAVLSLNGNALIDSYLDGVRDGSAGVAEYARTQRGAEEEKRIESEQSALIRNLYAANLIRSVNYTYTTVLNAVAVTTTYANFLRLEGMAGLKSVALSDTFDRPQAAEGADASAIVNPVDVYETGIFNSGTVSDLGITGKGTAVAILDSGFDCSHQVFQKQLDESKLLLTKAGIAEILPDFNAKKTTDGLKITDVFYSDKIPYVYDYADKDPDVFPYDSEHGTHVAGIIGGSAEGYTDKDGNPALDGDGEPIPFRGVAPDTQLVLMKVFPDLSEGADTDDILAALEDAVRLNVDAINLSLGSSCGFAREPDGDVINDVYDKIGESGVSLLTAASNSYSASYGGEQGNTNFVTNPDSGTVGSPSTYETALSVASISGTKSKYLVANGEQVVFFDESNNMAGLPNDFFKEIYAQKGWGLDEEHTIEYVTVPGDGLRVNYTTLVDENGDSLVEGRVALVRRGNTTFEDKALQAKRAGALACIIYNNIEGDILMSMGKSDHIPTVSISRTAGVQMAQRDVGTLKLSYHQQAGPFMSDFSSWGPLPDLTLKPEITAHGGNITSSVPGGGFDEISGTSMATPNLCGMVVLIRQFLKEQPRYSEYSWKQISDLANQMLMSTAGIILNEEGIPYSPRKQGAGLASLYNVVHAESYLTVDGIDRSKIELFDDPDRTGVYEMEFNVVNVSGKAETYDLSLFGMTETVSTSDNKHVAETGQQLAGSYTAQIAEGGGSLAGDRLTVPANATVKLKLVYTLTQADKDLIDDLFPYGMYVEGFVKLEAAGETAVDLNVPFLAFYGDWTQAPIFDKTYYEVESEAHDASIDDEDKLKADYYATTPYGSYLYNYLVALGTYLYDIDTSKYDEIPATEEHAAISDVRGTVDGISVVYAGLLRNCKTMSYTITDKVTGEVVYEYGLTNARKAFSQGGGPIPNYEMLRINALEQGFVNNHTYEFTMKGLLDYKRDGALTNVRNTFTFNFTLDNEAPIIESTTYEKEYDRTLKKDRYYLNLTVSDNQNVMSVAPFIFTSSSINNPSISYLTDNPIPVYGEKGEASTVRIEITDLLEDVRFDELVSNGIGILVDDYALNQNVYICTLPGTGGDFQFTRTGAPDSSRKATHSLEVGEIVDLTQYLSTTDSTVDEGKDYLKYLNWTSDNENVATVQEGQVLGIAPGRTTVTVRDPMMGKQASIIVSVSARAASYTLDEDAYLAEPVSKNDVPDVNGEALRSLRFAYLEAVHAHARAGQTAGLDTSNIGTTGSRTFLSSLPGGVSCYPGESFRLYYDLDPWYVADRYELTYESSNPDVADVDQNGIVVAMKRGSATITLRAAGSNIRASVRVTVNSEFVIDDTRTLVAYKGRGGDVVIPDDEGILYIGSFAFSLYTTDYDYGKELPEDDFDANKIPAVNESVRSVKVPEGVEQIQKYAFYNCTELTEVELPSSIKFIREFAFYEDAKLEKINLGDVEVIGRNAFFKCAKLGTTVGGHEGTVDLGITYAIGDSAFEGCTSLKYIDLTALRNTGARAFANCTSLAQAVLAENTKLSEEMFCGSGLASVDIYETNVVPVRAFAECKDLVSAALHSSLNTVGDFAFANCPNLSSVTLPNGAFAFGEGVFSDCPELTEVIFQAETRLSQASANVLKGTNVSKFSADGSTLYAAGGDGKLLVTKDGTTVVLAVPNVQDPAQALVLDGYTAIASGAFSGTNVTEVDLRSVTNIGSYAFAGCEALASVKLSPDISRIGAHAFEGCTALTSVNLDKATAVDAYAFARTGLKAVTVAANAVYGEGAFLEAALETVTVGAKAKFEPDAFQSCASLHTVNMPAEGGVHFGAGCFAHDTKLETIDLSKIDGIVESECFLDCTSLTEANLTNTTDIGDNAFADCSSLRTVNIPVAVSIGEGAFSRATEGGRGAAFTEIVLPDSLRSLGEGAFLGCENLLSVTIPAGIGELPPFAFAYCLALEEVVLPDDVTRIGECAFLGCSVLGDIDLGKVKTIGVAAFMSNYVFGMLTGSSSSGTIVIHTLEHIDLSSAEEIGLGAFAGSMVTGEISAPNLRTLGGYAFYKVNRSNYNGEVYPTVLSFDAPKLESIGISAFEGNVSMTSFKIYPSVKEIGALAFYGCEKLTAFTDGDGNATADINGYASVKDGVLYTRLSNGKRMLASVPAAKQLDSLIVEEGTYRVDDYAGNENKNISTIVLPDSLEYIGDHAFYNYTGLKTVEFRSVTAPALESDDINYVYGLYTLSEGDPGYEILQNRYSLNGFEKYYFNFIGLLGKRAPITMVLPANADLSGYDSVVYLVYFGRVEDAPRSTYVAMEQSMKQFLTLAERVASIETVTMADERLISEAVAALNATKQDPTEFGIDRARWDELAAKVTAANERIARIKVENAPKAVRLVQALLDGLPEVYDGTAACKEKLDAATAAIESLSVDDRSVLILGRYNSLMSSYENYGQGGGDTPGVQGGEGGLSAGAIAGIAVASAAVVIGAVVAVLLIRRKKSANK